MVDRVYTIWQGLDFETREWALDGTLTLVDVPPSRNATLNDAMSFEFSPDITIKQAMSPTKEGCCYIYS
ncbi:putative tyrosinase central protein [Glarea lozoyensis ATCC 20868]|uniref:Putative tyrosinase central protein n=1 Tax=Glarea lozoyensis (strain ATCC 20868 / MF5171) TaxID=1116229 RepID=S3DJ90_GLAL2|nr:putative tyrosinase central protein [Glarea lozoyensis ATCC 20868]EPE32106.1 putative tyrosinase central protein [Glarea lozoyensis ATCC 20868]